MLAAALLAPLALQPALAADYTARDVTQAVFNADGGRPVDFSGKSLESLDLAGLDFKAAILAKTNLYGADLSAANLKGSNLAGANLDRAVMTGTDFSNANLEGATIMAPSAFRDASFKRTEAPKFAGANLRGARIAARLDGADFRNADLSGAHIGPTDRSQEAGIAPASKSYSMDFSGATLDGAEVRDVEMMFSRFTGASLKGAKLINLDLSHVDFTGADLTGADLSGSTLDGANLSNVKGFETVTGLATVKSLDRAYR